MLSLTKHYSTLTLQNIGSVANLGFSLIEGEVEALLFPTLGQPADPIHASYFGCTKGKFRMAYPFSEQATVMEGQCVITNIATGERMQFGVGDSWFIRQGTELLWEVTTERFVKHYLAFRH